MNANITEIFLNAILNGDPLPSSIDPIVKKYIDLPFSDCVDCVATDLRTRFAILPKEISKLDSVMCFFINSCVHKVDWYQVAMNCITTYGMRNRSNNNSVNEE
jgi:hypothetical protein